MWVVKDFADDTYVIDNGRDGTESQRDAQRFWEYEAAIVARRVHLNEGLGRRENVRVVKLKPKPTCDECGQTFKS